MTRPISLTLFFPTYNEEENIEAVVRSARTVALQSPFIKEFEIIIVDDGSTDRTPKIVESLVERYSEVRVVHHPVNRGYGAAVKSGLRAARYDYIFFTDADLQFDLTELQNLLVHLTRYDAVIGYRAPRRDPWMRLANAWLWNLLNRILFGLQVHDIDCAFKIFKREMIQELPIRSRGAMINAEILIRLTQQGVVLKEVPVSHYPRRAGSPTGAKLSVIARALHELFALCESNFGPPARKELVKFISVGIINTMLDAGVYIGLTRFTVVFADELVMAKFASFMMGTISSLVLNHFWTFRLETSLTMREVLRFYASVSAALVVNLTTLHVLVRLFHVYDLLAFVIATGLSFIANYSLARAWVFRTRALPHGLSYAR